MDRIGAITQSPGGLAEHMDAAVAQGANLFTFVFYDLPNRDCAALASNGELRISENGFFRYQTEYVDPIVEILGRPEYSGLRIIVVLEVDSLPNLITNLNVPDCAEANGPGGYVDGITYALNRLSTVPNVYNYLDIAHSGWLGWSSNFGQAITLIGDTVANSAYGWNSVAGFISNTSNYTPVEEPFIPDPTLTVGGQPIRSASFYEWNDYVAELNFDQDWRAAMIARGAPTTLGMLIDTGRNGWGGTARPIAASTSTVLNTYVNESKIDKRIHRGNWCNQPGGVGYRPTVAPAPGIDAYVWVKPQGESDGISDPNFVPDPNDPAKQHDPMCNPNATGTQQSNGGNPTGAMPNAPHAGRWFPAAVEVLLQNAYPPL